MIFYRCFRQFRLHEFLQDLKSLPWYKFISEHDIEKKIILFNHYITVTFDKHAPIVEKKVTKRSAPWLTDTLQILKKERNKALQKYIKTKCQDDFNRYKELRNYTLAATRNEKKAYLNQVVQTKDSKLTWRTLKDFSINSKRNSMLPPNLCDPDSLNNFFASYLQNMSNDADNQIDFYMNSVYSRELTFSFRFITVEEVNTILHNIKTTAYGVDNINSKMLKLCSPFIDRYSQCGFRSGRSTVTALATVSNDIISAYDQGLSTALVLLDFSKAFDTISHELLCAKLQYYGFDKQSVFLIWNYFLRRSQTILSNGKFSAELEILSGVPQRSVLGPLLFIIYTADILNKIEKCKVQAYADDIQLYLSFRANDSGSAEAIINGECFIVLNTYSQAKYQFLINF
nr:unnamed protein product [Callosobruchus chinensis]